VTQEVILFNHVFLSIGPKRYYPEITVLNCSITTAIAIAKCDSVLSYWIFCVFLFNDRYDFI